MNNLSVSLKKISISICFSLFSIFLFSQDGLSPATAFTELGQANYNNITPGVYYFNINGTAFSTEVDGTGWVLLASSPQIITPGNLSISSTLTFDANSILPSSVYVGNTTIKTIRITSGLGLNTPFDVTTTNALELANLSNNLTLSSGYLSENHWVGTGASFMYKADCEGANYTLNSFIFHACGNFNGMHWAPSEGLNKIDYIGAGTNNFNLWVQADDLTPVPTLSQWGIIALALLVLIFGVIAVRQRRTILA